jgi:hypothetical protein
VGQEVKWFAQGESHNLKHGLKVILKYKDRNEVMRKFGISKNYILVKALKITAHSRTLTSVTAVIEEW